MRRTFDSACLVADFKQAALKTRYEKEAARSRESSIFACRIRYPLAPTVLTFAAQLALLKRRPISSRTRRRPFRACRTADTSAATPVRSEARIASTSAGKSSLYLLRMLHSLTALCSIRGLLKPPNARKRSNPISAQQSDESEEDHPSTSNKAKKEKATAKGLAGPAVEQDGDDGHITNFVKTSKRAISAHTAKTASSKPVNGVTSAASFDKLLDDIVWNDDTSLPDPADAAKMPLKPEKKPDKQKPVELSPDTSPNTKKKGGVKKQKSNERHAHKAASSDPEHEDEEDPWSDKEEILEEDESFLLPPPLGATATATKPLSPVKPSRKAPREPSLSLSPPKTKSTKMKKKSKGVSFKMPLRAESSVEDIDEEVRNLDDNHKRPVESDREESEYGNEDDPEPAGSEAEEDNGQEKKGDTSDEGEGDVLDFYDSIVIEDEDRAWEHMM